MKPLVMAALLVTGSMAVSCVKPVWVAYNTVPQGAMISYKDGSGTVGLAPTRSSHPLDQGDCVAVKGVRAIWLSGAQAVSDDQLVFCGNPGAGFGITLNRPDGYPGFDEDLAGAINFETLTQDSGPETASSYYRTIQEAQPEKTDINPNVKCRSQQIGNHINIICE
jgi:hypothetical protein